MELSFRNKSACWIDLITSNARQPRQDQVLVGSGKPRVADDAGHQNRGEFPGLAHCTHA
jgi:hypothetical protein